ncbi:MAG TPA: DUF1587 domain-containing protein, partial [Urbifossiella sp.]
MICQRSQFLIASLLLLASTEARAAEPFQDKVLPFLKTYCVDCHNAKKSKGDLDLTRFTSAAKLVEDFRQWEHVLTFLKKEEMPPAKAKQPSAELRAEMLAAIEKVLLTEARKFAGDPGIVPSRRLTNAEFDYTIRDITGADIRPARSFPIDPASGEGFNNTGEALTMSPSLFKKYYAAGEEVADHALLTTTGLKFAPHQVVTFADRQKYYEQAIIRFYENHAVDFEKYFTMLWLFKHRPASKKALTLESWAAAAGLSPKYARSLWNMLTGDSPDEYLIRSLRRQWMALPLPRNPAAPAASEVQSATRRLAANIHMLSRGLTPTEMRLIIPDAGNGPIEHLDRRAKTAEARDTFDTSVIGNTRFQGQFPDAANRPTLKLFIQIADPTESKNGGHVVLDGVFTTNSATTDGKKKWPLREVLSPAQRENLRFEGDTLTLAVPALLEFTIPTETFHFKDRGSLTFTADCKLVESEAGAVFVRVLDRKPSSNDEQNLARPLVDLKQAAAYAASANAFCKLFPNRFVYVDSTRGLSAGFHLIEGFFRDDLPLCRKVLSDKEKQELDRLWTELYFVTGIWEKMLRGFVFFERSERNFLKHADFDSFKEEDPDLTKDETLIRFKQVYLKRSGVKATGVELAKHPISVFFDDVRTGLRERTETLQRAEGVYLKDLLAFAEKAYRRPLTEIERRKIEKFFSDVCRDR